jgi:inner membrane protein COX18
VFLLGLAPFPVWLTFIETLRLMAGRGEGLLGLAASGVGWVKESLGFGATADSGYELADVVARVPMELSLADEGMLWFPDLLAADPELYLPAILSFSLFMNVRSATRNPFKRDDKTEAARNVTGAARAPIARSERLAKAFQVLSIGMFFLTLKMPAALMIYWITSSFFANLQRLSLEYFLPLPKHAPLAESPRSALGPAPPEPQRYSGSREMRNLSHKLARKRK